MTPKTTPILGTDMEPKITQVGEASPRAIFGWGYLKNAWSQEGPKMAKDDSKMSQNDPKLGQEKPRLPNTA